MTRRGGPTGPPRSIALARSIACEHSGWATIARRDALLEAALLAGALAADLAALTDGRARVAAQAEAAARGAA